MTDIRAILLDFDGTALQPDQVYISFRNMRALEMAMDKGIAVIPSTGRVVDMLPPQITANRRIRYAVTSNGARVVDMRKQVMIYQSVFTPQQSAQVCRIFENNGIYAEIAANGLIYMEKAVCDHLEHYAVPPHHVWFLDEKKHIELEQPSAFFLKYNVGIEKVNIYGVPSEKQQPIINGLLETGIVDISEGAGADIQFFPKQLDRGLALEALFAHLGIGYENVMAIGDSFLDAPTIEKAKIGVAVGNAPDWVKSKADYVSAPYNQDGVADAIEKYLL